MNDVQRVSVLPDDAIQGGSLSDVDVRVDKARFASWDYRGKRAPSCALLVTYRPLDHPDDEPLPDYMTKAYNAGPLEKYTPSADGTYCIPTGGATGFNKQSNFIALMNSMISAGFPKEILAKSDMSLIDGTVCHVVQVAQPKREGLKSDTEKEGDSTYVLWTKIVSLPGENGGPQQAAPATTTPKAAAKPKAAQPAAASAPVTAPPASNSELVEVGQSTVYAIVAGLGGKALKTAVAGLIFKQLAGEKDPVRKSTIIQLAMKDDNLRSSPLFTYDGETITNNG